MRRRVERDDVLRSVGEVQRERAVIAEAVECGAGGDASHERAVLALVEKGARLLATPWCGEIPDAVLVHLFGPHADAAEGRGPPSMR